MITSRNTDPHAGQPLAVAGAPLAQAGAAMIMIHGRGASAASILTLANEFDSTNIAYLAPQAAGDTWYPQRFMAPLSANEPWLSSALATVGRVLERVEAAGILPERTVLLGFSQGACLALEYAARNAKHYGGVVGLSGGLIGPDGTPRNYAGSLTNTPVFLGCSDIDFHIPKERVLESAEIMRNIGGSVTARLYPGMGHTVNQDEIDFINQLLATLA